MARGLTTPMPVIIVGAIGGTIAFGIVGLFFGPIVMFRRLDGDGGLGAGKRLRPRGERISAADAEPPRIEAPT